jgi:hypothetical protein
LRVSQKRIGTDAQRTWRSARPSTTTAGLERLALDGREQFTADDEAVVTRG